MAGVRESGFHIIASTNKPEKIDSALIQPQRFGILIHCGLQDEDARLEILKIHSGMTSVRAGHPLFRSEDEREIILKDVAAHTEAFTPRYLAAIANSAKSYLIERVSKEKGKRIGLTEEDLEGHVFTVEDWDKAIREISARYDKKNLKSRDQELKRFVDKHSRGPVGFELPYSRLNEGVAILINAKAKIQELQ
jgi:SpoVK/Ycf46/Vps4 family AAA+-type ATPase